MWRVMIGAAAVLSAACSGSVAHGPVVAVTAGDDSCDIATAPLIAGTMRFAATNTGKLHTDVAVIDGNRVLGQAKDIGPGSRKVFSVRLARGTYEISCAPGHTLGQIRTVFSVLAA